MKPYKSMVLIIIGFLFASLLDPVDVGIAAQQIETGSQTCPAVQNTPSFTIAYGQGWINGSPLPAGSIVETVTPRGDVAGCFQVTSAGFFGTMYVYGEDTSVTPAIPGFRSGEVIQFRINNTPTLSMPALAWSNDRSMHQVDQTNLNIAQSGNDALLSWYAINSNMNRYEVWRANAPYFLPGDAGSVKLTSLTPPSSPGMLNFTDPGAISNIAANYTYLVRGVSSAGKYSDSNRAGEYALSLSLGWNLLSLPLKTTIGYSAQSLLDAFNTSTPYCMEIDRYLESDWDAHLNNLPFNNYEIVTGQGSFVKCDIAGTWTTLGEVPHKGVPVNLTIGQNLLGVPYPANQYTAQSLLNGINAQGGSCSEVSRWVNGGWETHANGSPNNNFTVAPDKGYFVRCGQTSVFTP